MNPYKTKNRLWTIINESNKALERRISDMARYDLIELKRLAFAGLTELNKFNTINNSLCGAIRHKVRQYYI